MIRNCAAAAIAIAALSTPVIASAERATTTVQIVATVVSAKQAAQAKTGATPPLQISYSIQSSKLVRSCNYVDAKDGTGKMIERDCLYHVAETE
jgi:hypothetical protein